MKLKQTAVLALLASFFAHQGLVAQTLDDNNALDLPTGQKPNIILVMADDQGWGDVGYNGHPFVQTPELDAMAGDGFVLDRFYAAAPVCSPTRASVMTGRNPIRSKVSNHGRYMRPHEQTIAETLKDAGYVTGIFGKVHLGSGQPDSPCNPSGMGFDEWVVGLNFFDNDPYLSRIGKIEHRKGKGSVLAMDDALEFLNTHQDHDQPLFMVVWFPSPHDPHQEVPEGPSLYDGEDKAGYYREITLLDLQLGRLRRRLRDMEIADNTILWYCSDNGGLNESTSGGRERKGSIYEGGLRIPGIIEWPARKLNGRSAVPTWTCDIYPTLLAMAGIQSDAPHPLDGTDISNIIAGKAGKRSKPMGFWHNFQQGQATWSDRIQKAIMEKQQAGAPLPHNEDRIRKDVDEFPQFPEETTTGHAAWNEWPWKLHRINGKKYELYNLADDPMETTDRSTDPDQQVRLTRMQKELDDWMRSVVRSINGQDYQDINTTSTLQPSTADYSQLAFYPDRWRKAGVSFTNLGSGEKANRLEDTTGQAISPSDQPGMYATAMLELRRDYGGDKWVTKFCHALRRCKPARATDVESAKSQVLNWRVCASFAAGKDLTPIFADRWRMPLTDNQRQIMKRTAWSEHNVNVTKLVGDLVADTPVARPQKDSQTQSAMPLAPQIHSTDGCCWPKFMNQNATQR
ncbi:sulfatase family protein [Novipirellula artificiosorum]|nr:sulfatase-like hydrolase/transferase [Novipirellula artificiosorum]